jgi:hypothetical protein
MLLALRHIFAWFSVLALISIGPALDPLGSATAGAVSLKAAGSAHPDEPVNTAPRSHLALHGIVGQLSVADHDADHHHDAGSDTCCLSICSSAVILAVTPVLALIEPRGLPKSDATGSVEQIELPTHDRPPRI